MAAPPPPMPGSGPDHFTAPPAVPASASTSRRNLILAGVLGGGGCLLVVLVVIGLVILSVVRGGSSPTDGGDDDTTAAPPPLEEQAVTLVDDYMTALSSGDAQAALDLVSEEESADLVVLPVEAYALALEQGPVADVEVGTPELDSDGLASGDVPVSFTVGGEAVTETFSVHDFDDDGLLEITAVGGSTMVPDSLTGLGTTLNGAEVAEGDRLLLLPGAYEIAFTTEHFVPASPDPVLFGERTTSLEWPEPSLDEEGQKVFRGAVQKAVDACLESKKLAGGCAMGTVPPSTSDGWTATEDTVTRTISEDTQRSIDTMEGTPSFDEPTYVKGGVVGTVSTEYECTKDGQQGMCKLFMGGGIGIPNVDFADPELPVTWS